MPCTPIDVEVEIVTPDQMKQITFGLARLCNNDGSETWKINFELDEKQNSTDTDFKLVAKVSVTVGKDDHPAAESVAKSVDQTKSLSDAQTAQALVAADTLKDHRADPNHPDVQDDLTQVLHADE
jgi:hypothetical protein